MRDGTPGQPEQAITRSLQLPKNPSTGELKVIKTKTTENAHRLAGGIIDAGIKAILAKGSGTGTCEVVESARIARSGKCGQNCCCRWGNHSDRYAVAGTSGLRSEGGSTRSIQRVACGRIESLTTAVDAST